ncbi:prosaposin [Latimeria chalumnae]|uniref:Pulmonary surfactant-associated protein B n=1 Tax=Latimeria chalumnae TaxID=7897 RepID=H3A3Z6_LATCH|nr:PREDICTED: pulmonary surfactant-associated protein B [Latimeria chalumnae]|eukprot:XP_006009554.1 PREDICTED: pulmonary surfactant-associated protein B [Latimeria chalumnae]
MACLVFLVSLGLSSALAGTIPEQTDCAQGPEFWCQDLETASRCGAVEHCVQTVWSQPKADDNLCPLCKELIKVVGEMIKDQTLQDDIKKYLEKGCKLIPNPKISSRCTQLVDSYLSIIVTFLESELKPDVVCSALGLCKSLQSESSNQQLLSNQVSEEATNFLSRSLQLPKSHTWQDPDSLQALPPCTLCITVLTKLEEMLPKERTEEAVVRLLNKICSHLPYIAKQCEEMIDKYAKTILELILQKLGPHVICTLLHLCLGEDALQESVIPVSILESTECIMCQGLIQKMKPTVNVNTTGTEMEPLLQEVCYSIPGGSLSCKNFVESYKPELMKVLGKPWDTKTICQEIGACVEVKTVPLLGTNECTWGPSYWCKDMETAKQCNAVEHCRAHVWN